MPFTYIILLLSFYLLSHVDLLFFNVKKLENVLDMKIIYSVYSSTLFYNDGNKIVAYVFGTRMTQEWDCYFEN